MKLKEARLCLDCNCVYDSKDNFLWQEICPDCSSRATYLLVHWIGGGYPAGAINFPSPQPSPTRGEGALLKKEGKDAD